MPGHIPQGRCGKSAMPRTLVDVRSCSSQTMRCSCAINDDCATQFKRVNASMHDRCNRNFDLSRGSLQACGGLLTHQWHGMRPSRIFVRPRRCLHPGHVGTCTRLITFGSPCTTNVIPCREGLPIPDFLDGGCLRGTKALLFKLERLSVWNSPVGPEGLRSNTTLVLGFRFLYRISGQVDPVKMRTQKEQPIGDADVASYFPPNAGIVIKLLLDPSLLNLPSMLARAPKMGAPTSEAGVPSIPRLGQRRYTCCYVAISYMMLTNLVALMPGSGVIGVSQFFTY